jgi:uncharacterized metal-binding protein
MAASCSSTSADTLIFACSGAADVGELADRAARSLTREGSGKMYCLSGIGAGLESFIDKTKKSPQTLVIDGCPVDCAKKCLARAGIDGFEYIRITDLGFEKGKCPVTPAAIEQIVLKSKQLLAC